MRFEVSVRALAPDLDVLAPVRVWGFTREDSIDYAARHDIPIKVRKDSPFSIDENLWGRAIECGVLEDPWAAPPVEIYALTDNPNGLALDPWELVVGFEQGVPVSLDGEAMPLDDLVLATTARVGPYGWGRVDMVENRRVGIKSRENYECPGALALLLAHADLESITLERDLMREKARLEPRYAELVYDGLWFSPLREALDSFMASSQQHVTGEVRLRLEPRQLHGVGAPRRARALPPRPRHLRRVRHLPAPGRRGLRTALGALGRDLGTRAGRAGSLMTLWHGRFADGPADELLAFTESLSFDQRLAPDDIVGSRAHVAMLARAGLLTDEEASLVIAALDRVGVELADGTFVFAPGDEDIHTAIERRVTELAGPAGAKLHTGRSRNDQVATALRLFLKREGTDAARRIHGLQEVLLERGEGRRLRRLPPGLHAPPARAAGAARASLPRALLGVRA